MSSVPLGFRTSNAIQATAAPPSVLYSFKPSSYIFILLQNTASIQVGCILCCYPRKTSTWRVPRRTRNTPSTSCTGKLEGYFVWSSNMWIHGSTRRSPAKESFSWWNACSLWPGHWYHFGWYCLDGRVQHGVCRSCDSPRRCWWWSYIAYSVVWTKPFLYLHDK